MASPFNVRNSAAREYSIAIISALLCLPLASFRVWGSDLFGPEWNGEDTTMSINLNVGGPSGNWNTQVENAIARWNASGCDFRFGFNHNNRDECDSGVSCFIFCICSDENSNAVEWNDLSDGFCGNAASGALAVTLLHWVDGLGDDNFCDADILFSDASGLVWTENARPLTCCSSSAEAAADRSFSPFELNSVAIHELGHVLGLDHENRFVATLNSIYHPDFNHIHADDIAGCRRMYGGPARTDIGLTKWTKTSTSSTARASLVTGPTTANAGASVSYQFTVENLGTTEVTFDTRFYLSTNSTISTSDTSLATNNNMFIARPPNAPVSTTFSKTVTIPSNTATGDYFLGVIIDYNNQVSEHTNSNNALAQPRMLHVTCPSIVAPTGVAASDNTFQDRVRVTWSAVSGASSYEVWRNTTSSTLTATRIAQGIAGTTYDDLTAVPGTTYFYRVKAKRICQTVSSFSSANTGSAQDCGSFTIGGAIFSDCANPLGNGVNGVAVAITGPAGNFNATTNALGIWSRANVPCGSYTVTPTLTDREFCRITGATCPPASCVGSQAITVNQANLAANQDLRFLARAASCRKYDMNNDTFITLVGDVDLWVQCAFFGVCNDPRCPGSNCTCPADCNCDGIVTQAGDLPCFTSCLFFNNCAACSSEGVFDSGGNGGAGRIGGTVFADDDDPLGSGITGMLVEVLDEHGELMASTMTGDVAGVWGVGGLQDGEYTVVLRTFSGDSLVEVDSFVVLVDENAAETNQSIQREITAADIERAALGNLAGSSTKSHRVSGDR